MKRFIILALIAIVGISLSACSGEPTKTASAKPAATPTTDERISEELGQAAEAADETPDYTMADANGDGVVDDEDIDPNADDSAPTEDEDAPTEDAPDSSQTVKQLGQWGEDDGMKVKVLSMEKVDSIPAVDEFYETVTDKPGSSLVAVKIEVKNNGDNDIDPLCGGGHGFVLLDQNDRNFDALDSLLDINDNVCGDGIQPGFKSSYTIAYRLPAGSKIGGLVVWNSDNMDDFSGDESELLFMP